jgi:predicted RNA binding protein YcfA (HicA-like mRNA interferase family)
MTPALRMTAKQIIAVIEREGCAFLRQKGSHRMYRTPQGKRITVPCHAGKILHPKVVRSILKGLQISVEEFQELL